MDPTNFIVRLSRNVYHSIGFSKGYNFILWFIFSSALMGFTIARMPYLDFYGVFCNNSSSSNLHAGPGECWYYLRSNHEKVGIMLHLTGIIPAAFLACFQFIPVIRHKIIIFHRINGYTVLLLSLVGTAGVFMILRHAFGGGLDIQMSMGLLGIMFIGSLAMAFINIKRFQIEEHRAWMLRAWFYAGSIITLRLIMVISAVIISAQGDYYTVRPCAQIENALVGDQNATLNIYPECLPYYSGDNLDQQTIVHANITGNEAEVSAALGMNFGTAGWLALALHAIGVEIYLRLTPVESERLRHVSYQRQAEARMTDPGRAGLTVDRFGDAKKWVPTSE